MFIRLRSGLIFEALRLPFAKRIKDDTCGAITVLSLFLFLAMLLVSGIAIDVVRAEHARVKLQGTLDRAILAAADKDNLLNPKDVVMDYFAKAGLSAYMTRDMITYDDDESFTDVLMANGTTVRVRDITYRNVEAATMAVVPTMFLNRVGIDSLPALAGSRAVEGITPIEIVLVLDVSGSMVSSNVTLNGTTQTRLQALKTSAINFVNTIYANPQNANRIAISIVPYAWNYHRGVAAGAYGRVTGTADTGCLMFDDDSDYQTEVIDPAALHERAVHADSFTGNGNTLPNRSSPVAPSYAISGSASSNNYLWDCQKATIGTTTTGQLFTPYTNNVVKLKAAINALTGGGSTSIDIGMKWGTHLIDPSYRSVNVAMVGAGHTPEDFAGIPYDYGRGGTKKYIVLMSDGDNKPNYAVNPDYRAGFSPIFEGISSSNRRYSFHDPDRSGNKYFWASDSAWHSDAEGTSATRVRLTWPQVWDKLAVSWVAYNLYARRTHSSSAANRYDAIYDNMVAGYADETSSLGDALTMIRRTNSSKKDTRLQSSCDTVRDNKLVTVFTIAFRNDATNVNSEADLPTGSDKRGVRELAKCASSYAHYFPASSGTSLQAAFNSIATQIIDLRLTQ